MTIKEMINRKIELGYTNADLAERSGVPLSTVNKIFGGITKAPRRETLLSLESVLVASKKSIKYTYTSAEPLALNDSELAYQPNPISFQSVPYDFGYFLDPEINARLLDVYSGPGLPPGKQQGEYTIDDYMAIPDDIRVELIDGVFYYMSAPTTIHQFISAKIGYMLMHHIEENGGKCRTMMAPVDVQIDKSDKTILQPDIMIICKPELLIKRLRVYGAPDLLMEILSPSTKRKDMSIKLNKYLESGVKEYWLIDPDKLQVMVYLLEILDFPTLYTFEDKVPVHIWNDEFSIDFKEVYDYIKDYLED